MKNILEDVSASIAVFLVALPLCLGIALASDMPLVSGLIAGIVGGILIGAFGGSEVSVSGPAAGLVVVVAGAVHELGSYQLLSLALLLAGIIQIGFALMGLHRFTDLIPQSVVKGMLAAIGILICIKEYPYILGLNGNTNSVDIPPEPRLSIFCVSLFTGITILLWQYFQKERKLIKNIPASLIGVLFGSLIAHLITLLSPTSMSVNDFVRLPRLFDHLALQLPNFQLVDQKVLKVSLVLALIASIETLLCLEAAIQLDPLKRTIFRKKEVFAQGLGNIASGLLGGLPITAVIVRTAANIEAGARTRLAAVFHGVLIGLSAIFFVDIINRIPLSALAVVLVLVGFKLFSPKIFISKKNKGTLQFSVFILTILSILLSDLLIGVTIGTIFYHAVATFVKRSKNVVS